MEQQLTEQLIEVNGEKITKEQFEEMLQNPNIKLKKISEGVYKKLDKLQG